MGNLQMAERILLNGYFLAALTVIGVAFTVRAKVSVKGPRIAMVPAWLLFIFAVVQLTENASNRAMWIAGGTILSLAVCSAIALWMGPGKTAVSAGTSATSTIPQITISPVFNNSPAISANIAQNIAPAEPERRPQPEPAARPAPNLIFLRARVIRVTDEMDRDQVQFHESRIIDDHDPRAIIACFRNEPAAPRALDARNVRAQIIYRNDAGIEIGNGIPRACWLEDSMDLIDFHVGDSHCAMLIFVNRDGTLYVPWKRRRQTGYGDVVTTQVYEFGNEVVRTIEIRVLGSANELLLDPIVFEFSISHGEPQVRVRDRVPE